MAYKQRFRVLLFRVLRYRGCIRANAVIRPRTNKIWHGDACRVRRNSRGSAMIQYKRPVYPKLWGPLLSPIRLDLERTNWAW